METLCTFFIAIFGRVIALPPSPEGGMVGPPKAIRGGVAAAPYMLAMERMLKRCHPLPARLRGPTSPQPNLAVARVRPLNKVAEVGNSRLRLGRWNPASAALDTSSPICASARN
jgi:hypothetical protein